MAVSLEVSDTGRSPNTGAGGNSILSASFVVKLDASLETGAVASGDDVVVDLRDLFLEGVRIDKEDEVDFAGLCDIPELEQGVGFDSRSFGTCSGQPTCS